MQGVRRNRTTIGRALAASICVLAVLAAGQAAAQGAKKTIGFQDLMKFRAIQQPVISPDGRIVAYGAKPDRGDGEGLVHVLAGGKVIRVPRGERPAISKDGRFVVMGVAVAFADSEKPARERPKTGMAIVDTTSGAVTDVANVDRYVLSADGKYLAYLLAPPETGEKPTTPTEADDEDGELEQAPGGRGQRPAAGGPARAGSTLKLRSLAAGSEQEIALVSSFVFDPSSRFLAYVVTGKEGKGNGLFCRDLADANAAPITVASADNGQYAPLSWTKTGSALAFVAAVEAKGEPGPGTVWIWDGASRKGREVVTAAKAPYGWTVPARSDLAWSKDGKRLFLGLRPATPPAQPAAKKAETPDPYDFAPLLAQAELDVWHWNDPRINSQQKLTWAREKDRTYRAVYHLDTSRLVTLAGPDLPDVEATDHPRVALGTSDVPYQKQSTWGGGGRDVYLVNLADGSRKQVLTGFDDRAQLSPDGASLVFFKDRQWHAYDCQKGTTRILTQSLRVVLHNEEHDTPSTAPAYGLAGWVDDGAAVLIYDRTDIWQVPLAAGGKPINLTAQDGRKRDVTYRVVRTDPDARSFATGQPILLSAYHNEKKNWGFYAARPGTSGVEPRIDDTCLFKFVAKADEADAVLFTRETYGEYPDLWVSDAGFKQPKRVSDVNPQIAEFAWGTSELVEWTSLDGMRLQGVLIKPANYKPGTRYPVITYFYERQSNRLYEFNQPVVNHRPSFAVYAGAGYAIFLPDIVFDIGHPGPSILKCLVPGVQKLVDMGIADPKRLGLHGHSWGGYGTVYLITQTNMFAAAVSGAPVSNMTSAYGGIRWESGVARQFQYEQTQSRIGGSLWEYPERYVENSALFHADRITTPLLIEHGDADGAVPWYQAIEMYLAMRRLGKDCIFLQYRGEPHHLQKYPNKLDYSIKMKEYFDHYLKGEPAPAWIAKGVAYQGK